MWRHASVLHWYTLKVVFRQLRHVSNSFNDLSVHCVTSGSGASFLYKCPTSRGGSLRQQGFLVSVLAIRTFRTLLLMALRLMSISVGIILLSFYVTEFSNGWFRRKLWDLVCLECREENRAYSDSSIRLRPNLVLIRPWTTPHNSPARTYFSDVKDLGKTHENSSGDEIANLNFFTTTSYNTSKYNPLLNIQHNAGRGAASGCGLVVLLRRFSHAPIYCKEVRF